MNKEYIYKHLISSLYKMLCWREEKKKWQTIYDELLAEISLGQFDNDFKAQMLLKIVPLKYYTMKNSILQKMLTQIFQFCHHISTLYS